LIAKLCGDSIDVEKIMGEEEGKEKPKAEAEVEEKYEVK